MRPYWIVSIFIIFVVVAGMGVGAWCVIRGLKADIDTAKAALAHFIGPAPLENPAEWAYDIADLAQKSADHHAEERAAVGDLLPLVADAVSWLRHHHLDAPASTLEEVAERVEALMGPVTQTPPPAAGP